MGFNEGHYPANPSRQAIRPGWQEFMFLLLIGAAPFLASPPMAAPMFGVQAFRMYNFLPGLPMIAFLAGPGIGSPRDALGRRAYYAFFVYAALIAFGFLRSLPNLPQFYANWPDAFSDDPRKYFQAEYALPMLVACSFLYVLTRLNGPRGVAWTLETICLSTLVLSTVVIGAVTYDPAPLVSPDRHAMLVLMTDTLAMHYNTVGTILAMTAPLLLYMALKRGGFWGLPYALGLAAVLVAKSRTGLLTFAGMSALEMVVLGRARTLVAIAPLVAVAAVAVLGSMLINLLTIGFTQKSGVSLFLLLSGREQSIWLPSILEWFGDWRRLLFGAGLHGILTSEMVSSGAFGFIAGQAHNVYLEFFLDNGIILLAAAVAIITWLLFRGWKLGRRLKNPAYWSLYLCVVAFLITGFSGRVYYPDLENYLMFPILAVLINVVRLRLSAESKEPGRRVRSVPRAANA